MVAPPSPNSSEVVFVDRAKSISPRLAIMAKASASPVPGPDAQREAIAEAMKLQMREGQVMAKCLFAVLAGCLRLLECLVSCPSDVWWKRE